MSVLVLGLVLFLGVHSVRIFAESWRTRQIARLGEKGWKGAYSVVSAVGLVLIIWGYGIARRDPVVLWAPPVWAPHLAALLTLIAFIFFLAAYVPGNHFKAWVKHPQALSVGFWAFAHLLANGTLADVLLFGGFLGWAVADRISLKRRSTPQLPRSAPPRSWNDALAVTLGVAIYALFIGWAHLRLFGVSPLDF